MSDAETAAEIYTMPQILFLNTRFQALRQAYPISPITLTCLTLVYIFCATNGTFWSVGGEVFSGHVLSFTGFMAAVFFLTLAFFGAFGFPWTVKPFLMSMVILSAVTSYYMDTLGVIIDRDMIQNVMVTTFTESKHLLTAGFISHVVIFGFLPALLIANIKFKTLSNLKIILAPVLTVVLSFSLTVGLLLTDLKSYAFVLRDRKDLMATFQPGMPLASAARYIKMMTRSANITITALGEDATKGPAYGPDRKPLLTIVVAGETARAQNFSLNGYGVETNLMLANLPVISFAEVASCGTATATSLPCMFSNFNRVDYSYQKGISSENVLDVLTHAGLHVEWWDNNTGHKAVGDRIPSRMLAHTANVEFCSSGERGGPRF